MVIACCVCTSFDLIILCYVLESKCLLPASAASSPCCCAPRRSATISLSYLQLLFSEGLITLTEKETETPMFFKKARLKNIQKSVDSSVCSSIIIFSGTLRWSLVLFHIQTNCFSSPVFAFLVSSHIIIFWVNFSNSGDYWNLSAFLFWLKS